MSGKVIPALRNPVLHKTVHCFLSGIEAEVNLLFGTSKCTVHVKLTGLWDFHFVYIYVQSNSNIILGFCAMEAESCAAFEPIPTSCTIHVANAP